MAQQFESEKIAKDIEEKLDNTIYGLSALKDLIDAVEAKLDNAEFLLKFSSAEALDDIAAVGPTNTTELPITITIPAGATIRRVILAAFITVMNDTATLQKIDVDVQGRVAGGAWNTYFSENACIGLPNVDAASTGMVALQDVSTLVTVVGTFGFRISVTQTAANSVHYTTQFLLIITYRMS